MSEAQASLSPPSDRVANRFFLSRQPILTVQRKLMGWDLRFGSVDGEALTASHPDPQAYHEAVLGFASSASWDSLLCGARALLPVDRKLLFSELVERLPRNRFLLCLPPMDEVDASLTSRLHDLHARRGVRLLFQDYARRDPREQLLDLADAVEVDASGTDEDARSMLIRRAQRRSLQALVSGIDRDLDFVRARDAGFELFAGRSYAEPSKDEETRATTEGRVLLELMLEARGELEIEPVTRKVEANPALEEGLLRLVNSLELARAQRIENVGQALILIGAKGLSRWLNLLLFQIGSRHGTRGALFRVAASRARLMELMVHSGAGAEDPRVKEDGQTAFLIGILSLVHVLLGTDREHAIAGLSLPPEMARALLAYEGPLGRLLRFSECLDQGAFAEVAQLAQELSLSPDSIWAQQSEAYDWVMQMV